ncbi:MAG: hypothetical protein WD227_06205 [Vicinamibacterales bacterium]
MADFSATIRTLEQQRKELLDQVAAIDRAIAALNGSDKPYRKPSPVTIVEPAVAMRRPAVKKRRFALSEEHKRKLVEGRKRAREARLVPAPAAEATAAPVAAWTGDGLPRLVKRDAES